MGLLHYSKRTENGYTDKIAHIIHVHNLQHSRDMGAVENEQYLVGVEN